jgi:hypothetical protein
LEGELAISTASLAELHFGVLVTADPMIRAERLRRLSDLQRTFTKPRAEVTNLSPAYCG